MLSHGGSHEAVLAGVGVGFVAGWLRAQGHCAAGAEIFPLTTHTLVKAFLTSAYHDSLASLLGWQDVTTRL